MGDQMGNATTVSSKRFIVGNWKCSKNLDQAQAWLTSFARDFRPQPELQVIIAPPTIWLVPLARQLQDLSLAGVHLAAQDVSPFPRGSYTGAIAADMLTGSADYAIIGHGERRRYFHETSQDAVNKVSEAVDAGIKPIICVDTASAMSQLVPLGDLDSEQLVIAYCPVEAMSYREAEKKETVEEAVRFIGQIHPARPIIYGGAITPDNARDYAAIPGLSGLFVGQASLDPAAFVAICTAVAG
ncbi:MAG: triose-phosphate isomerase family protein [Desulfofustis sp.]|nr:triose-phosphate isomerase family protein [Desulfofustis sp.]